MRRLHLLTGLLGVVAFLASGQYMDVAQDHLRGLDGTARMLFRSRHIYLLFAALLNLALGLYLTPGPAGWRRWLQRGGSALLLTAPWLLAVAFLTEPWYAGAGCPYSLPACIASLTGTLLHLVSRVPRREAAAERLAKQAERP